MRRRRELGGGVRFSRKHSPVDLVRVTSQSMYTTSLQYRVFIGRRVASLSSCKLFPLLIHLLRRSSDMHEKWSECARTGIAIYTVVHRRETETSEERKVVLCSASARKTVCALVKKTDGAVVSKSTER